MASSWASFVVDLDPNSFRGAGNANVSGSTEMWPMYSVDEPMDYVFDANVSSHAERDTFRAEGIKVVNDASLVYRR